MRRFLPATMGVALLLAFGLPMNAAGQLALQAGPQQSVPGGAGGFIAAADFNGDGIDDLVVNNRVKVTALLSNSDGSLGTGLSIIPHPKSGGSLRGLVVGDFNNDQTKDLAVVDFWSGDVYRMTGRTDGTFNQAQSFASGLRYARDLAVADLNGAPADDVAVAHSLSNAVTVLLNAGPAGKYLLSLLVNPKGVITFSVGKTPVRLRAADLNGDGLMDLVSVNTGGAGADDVSVLLNTGKGRTFAGPTNFVVGVGASDLAIADFNGDGAPDIAVLNAGVNSNTPDQYSVSVLLNRTNENGVGTGFFDNTVPITIDCPTLLAGVRTTCTPAGIAAGDFNGDGTMDIAVSIAVSGVLSEPDGLLAVYTGRPDGSGTFDLAAQEHIASGAGPIVAGDFTGHFNSDKVKIDDIGVYESSNATVRIVRVIAPPPPATRTPTVTPTPLPQADGSECTDPVQCESQNCVDLVCCHTQCSQGPPPEYCNISFSMGTCHQKVANNGMCGLSSDCVSNNCVSNRCAPPATSTPTVTPTPLRGGDVCTPGGLPCGSGLVCNGEGVCCITATCPLGQSCRQGGVCAVLPTVTATATPKTSNGLACNGPDDCLSGSCTNNTCCESACEGPMRCDIFQSKGTCAMPLAVGDACEKNDDCEPNLICNVNLPPPTAEAAGACDFAPTPLPTLPPTPAGKAQCGPNQADLGNGQCADVSTSRGGGCSVSERAGYEGVWLLAIVPLAFAIRRFSRKRVRVHVRYLRDQ